MLVFSVQAQEKSKEFRAKFFEVKSDTIQIDTLSINSQKFRVLDSLKQPLKPTEYTIDFAKATLILMLLSIALSCSNLSLISL